MSSTSGPFRYCVTLGDIPQAGWHGHAVAWYVSSGAPFTPWGPLIYSPPFLFRGAWRAARRCISSRRRSNARRSGEAAEFTWGHNALIGIGPRQEYFEFIESAMLDGIFDERELREAARLGEAISMVERRGVHAQVFVNALQEVLSDGEVSHAEATYIASVREALHSLGWAP